MHYSINTANPDSFNDFSSVILEFLDFYLVDYYEFNELIKYIRNEPDLKCYIVKCQKNERKSNHFL